MYHICIVAGRGGASTPGHTYSSGTTTHNLASYLAKCLPMHSFEHCLGSGPGLELCFTRGWDGRYVMPAMHIRLSACHTYISCGHYFWHRLVNINDMSLRMYIYIHRRCALWPTRCFVSMRQNGRHCWCRCQVCVQHEQGLAIVCFVMFAQAQR